MSDEEGTKKYSVGYGKPPAETRFKKGQSGNPRGRPRVAKKKAIDTGFGMNAVTEMLLAEAYRTVMLREGDKVIELPAIQAVFRSLGVQAVKGSRLAAKSLADMVQTVEREHYQLRFEHFGKMIDYKQGWEERFAECDRAGRPRPEPIPHPDDIHINTRTGDVKVLGPMSADDKKDWDRMLARRDEAQSEVTEHMRLSKAARDPDRKLFYKKEALFEQRIFDIINDGLPDRYKTKLQGRMWRQEDLDLIPPYKPKRHRSP